MFDQLKKIFPFLHRKERFLVIELLVHSARATFLRADFERKYIEVVAMVSEGFNVQKDEHVFAAIKKALKALSKFGAAKIIISLAPEFATTIHSSVVMMRDNVKRPIDESDLENHIGKAIWKLLDQERGRAALKMGVGDLELAVADVRVRGIRLDGHRVVNPIGFKARTVEIRFTQTLHPRSFLESLQEKLPRERIVLIAEGGVMDSDVLAKSTGTENFLMVRLMDDQSQIYYSQGSTIGYHSTVQWGRKNLIEAIQDLFSVSEKVADKIMGLYLISQASKTVLDKIEKTFLDSVSRLTESLRKPIISYGAGTVYLLPFFEVPEFMISQRFRGLLERHPKIQAVRESEVEHGLGFEVKYAFPSKENLYTPLAALAELYFSSTDDTMNKIARRHARWLIS